MSSATIERLGGLAALAGGVLITITALVGLVVLDYENFDETARTGTYTLTAVLYLLAVILVLGGVVGLFTSQVQAAGSLGVFGFLLVFFGTALMAGAAWFEAFAARTLPAARYTRRDAPRHDEDHRRSNKEDVRGRESDRGSES